MELRIKDYLELEKLGIDYKKAEQIAPSCKNIRELEYNIYFNDRKIHKSI